MKKKTVILIMFFIVSLLLVGCSGGDSTNNKNDDKQVTYEIIIDNTVEIVFGKENKLSPYLVDSNGTTVASRFDYIISTDKVSVDVDGYVTWTEFPKENVAVTISERNTGTKKTITLIFVVEQLSKVTTISDADGQAIDAINEMKIGEEITLNVITNLGASVAIEPYCFINAADEQGQSKTVFEPAFTNNQIILRAIGFGKGTLVIEIKDTSGQKIYDFSVPYSIDLQDSGLANKVLESNNTSALGQSEIGMINTITVDDTVKNLSELSLFENLKTVVLKTNKVLTVDNISTSYAYRIPAGLYNSYYGSSEWSAVKDNLAPYDLSVNERYVIYHSDRVELLSYAIIDSDFSLKTLTLVGYTNTGWKDSTGNLVSNDFIKNSSEACIHLFANWEANTNRVVFNGNGATLGSMEDQLIPTNESVALKNNQFIKDGYVFAGWATSADGTVVYNDGAAYEMNTEAEHNLYAVWLPNENVIVFNANGGEGNMTPLQTATDTKVILSKNQFSKRGYTFAGWSTVQDGTVEYYDEAEYLMGASSNNTLYAVWSIITYSITYELNGGTADNPVEYTIETDSFSLNPPTRAGFTFRGWVNTASGGYKMNITVSKGSIGNLHFEAEWITNENGINFHANGGTGTMSAQVALTGETKTLSKNQFARSGYTFAGWSTTPTGAVEYADRDQYIMGTDSSYTLYAVWTPNTNNINFHANGGIGTMSVQSATTGETKALSQNQFTRSGYAFAGWSTTPTGAVEYTDQAQYTMGTDSSYTLYAVWTPIQYSISYNLGGGTDMGNQEEYNIESDQITLIAPTRSGYVFAGWTGEGIIEPTKDVSITTGSIGHKTYTAVWAATVHLHANGGEGTIASVTVITNTSEYVLPKHTYTRDGYLFDGWSLSANGSIAFEKESVFTCGADGEYHLYAVWTEGTEGLIFASNENGYSVVEYNGVLTDINIPSKYRGKEVNCIADTVFKDNTQITSIVIPTTVKDISNGLLSGCSNLTSIAMPYLAGDYLGYIFGGTSYNNNSSNIPTKLTNVSLSGGDKIAANAFYNCTGLSTIVISSSTTSIYSSAFVGCINIKNITVDKNNTAYKSVDGNLYTKDGKTLMQYALGKTNTSFTIPTDVTTIGNNAFRNCKNIKSVILPNGVVYIENYAFSGCDKLSSISIPSNVKSIGEYSFQSCTKLTSIVIPNSVTAVGRCAFYGCSGLSSVSIGNNVKTIGVSAFDDCIKLTSITIPDSVTSLGESAFEGCDSLITVTIGNGVKTIGWYTFARCDKLTNVTIGSNVTKIEDYAFQSCPMLTNIVIPNSVTSIGDCAFNATGLISAIIGDGVKSIGYGAFCYCSDLTSVTIGTSVTSIGDDAFEGCRRLVEVINKSSLTITKGSSNNGGVAYYALEVHNGESKIGQVDDYIFFKSDAGSFLVSYIGADRELVLPEVYCGEEYAINQYAFYTIEDSRDDEAYIVSISISDNVTSIGKYSFGNCRSLETLTIGKSITSIGDWAFSGCDKITNIYYNGDALSWCSIEFCSAKSTPLHYDKYHERTLYFKNAAGRYEIVTSLVIPEGIVKIGEYTFYSFPDLKNITIPKSVTSMVGYAFYNCSSLENVYYDGDISSWCSIVFDDYYSNPVYYANNLYVKTVSNEYELVTALIIPNNVTSIGDYAFCGYNKLSSVTIGNNVTSIGEYAFRYCDYLKTVVFNNVSGWSASKNTIDSSSLSDPSQAATYLTKTYPYCSWSRG